MTGLERNGDIVEFASYAPLLGRIGHCQWHPDLIYFDGRNVYPTINYYVQQIFSLNSGDKIIDNVFAPNVKYASCVIDSNTGDIILKMVNITETPQNITAKLPPLKGYKLNSSLTTLTGESLDEINEPGLSEKVRPQNSAIEVSRNFIYQMSPRSLSVIRIQKQ